jgi:hypothetical protein
MKEFLWFANDRLLSGRPKLRKLGFKGRFSQAARIKVQFIGILNRVCWVTSVGGLFASELCCCTCVLHLG